MHTTSVTQKIIPIIFIMNLAKELESLGLDEKEAKVYIAALEIGKGTAQEIAQKAGISRPTTYFVLERLMKLGLVGAESGEKHQTFVPENPTQLQALLDEQERALALKKEKTRQLVRELESINAAKTGKPIVKYYLGKEGILRMAKASFSKNPDSERWIAYNEDAVSQYLTPEERLSLTQKSASRKAKTHAVYNSKTEETPWRENGKRVPENDFPLPADIAVYEDKVRITSFHDEVGIIIRNTAIATTLRSLLRLAHKEASDLQEEEK